MAGMAIGASDLGLGTGLQQQVGEETDEERRRRLMQQQQQKLAPGASLAGASTLMTGYSTATPFA